ncbi:MAG: hypothetical protein KC506_03180 [Nanoarchaeota archaeon]|nr:hypothetical protein [Nanoarchaeota archaeon]
MELLYHGTHLRNGLEIAESGAILSPWYKYLEELNGVYRGKEGLFEEHYSGRTMVDVALENAAFCYSRNELEHRVKSLSVSKLLSGCGGAAGYGMQFEEYNGGGMVLALEIDEELERSLPNDWEDRYIIFVPKRLELKTLRQIHLSPRAAREAEKLVRKSFEKYNPEILYLNGD